jgi:tryptophan synthase alpha chain
MTAGDPDVERSVEIIDTACDAGLDILEIGIPFSDPTADGPIIQRASNRAIKSGMTLEKGIDIVRKLRQKHQLPMILFSYFNPIFSFGTERFVKEAAEAGADGILAVDLPSEYSDEIMQYVKKPDEFHFIRLISPTTDKERRNEILRQASGFIYVVSRRGVTGGDSKKIDWNGLKQEITEMRQETSVPLCIGFGISSPDDVRAAGTIADGVIIGSAFQRRVEENPDAAKQSIADFVRQLRNA